MKYKITVQPVGEGTDDLPDEAINGIECDGFLIISEQGNIAGTVCHNMSTFGIAAALADNESIIKAAALAVVVHERVKAKK